MATKNLNELVHLFAGGSDKKAEAVQPEIAELCDFDDNERKHYYLYHMNPEKGYVVVDSAMLNADEVFDLIEKKFPFSVELFPASSNDFRYYDEYLYDMERIYLRCIMPEVCTEVFSNFACVKSVIVEPECTFKKVKTMERMFYDLNNLSILVMEGIDCTNAESAKDMFSGCSKLTQYPDIDTWDLSSMVTTEGMFWRCSKMSGTVVLNRCNAVNLRTTEGMFFRTAIERVSIMNANLRSLENIDSMFAECEFLREVYISQFVSSGLRSANRVFEHCKSLDYLSISKWDAPILKSTMRMFYGCKSLSKIIRFHLQAGQVSDYDEMFGLTGLLQLDLSYWDIEKYVQVGLIAPSNSINLEVILPFSSAMICKSMQPIVEIDYVTAENENRRGTILYKENGSIETNLPYLTAKEVIADFGFDKLELGKEDWLYRMTYQAFGHTDRIPIKTGYKDYTSIFKASSDYNKFIGLCPENYQAGSVIEMWEAIFWPGAYNSTHSDLRDAVGCCVFGMTDKYIDIITYKYHFTIDVSKIEKGFNMKVGEFIASLYGVTIKD